VLGTPSFMSPEQLAGQPVDGRSDLYSLGVMLFQLLTGTLPLRGDSMAALMYQIANQPAPDVRERRPELPQELADILSKTLSKSPAQRYQTGLEIAADLRKTIAALSLSPDFHLAPHGVRASEEGSHENEVLATVVTRVPVSSREPETVSFDIRL
jgi:serine/threonine protein kinase